MTARRFRVIVVALAVALVTGVIEWVNGPKLTGWIIVMMFAMLVASIGVKEAEYDRD